MKNTIIKAFKAFTPVTSKTIGQSVDSAIHGSFKGNRSIPLQIVVGETFAMLNRKGFLENNIKNFSLDMDATIGEQEHHKLVEETIDIVLDYCAGYGDILYFKSQKRGKWSTHWKLNLDRDLFRLMDTEEPEFRFLKLKKLQKAAVQELFTCSLGLSTDVEKLDFEYLTGLKNQSVQYKAPIAFLKSKRPNSTRTLVEEFYCESRVMATGRVNYRPTPRTKSQAIKHMLNINELDGCMFPVTEELETRGRTAKEQLSIFGLNLYGKTEETQSFHLGDETIAYDARQSMYALMGALIGFKKLNQYTGTYGSTQHTDIYTEVFMKVLERVFGGCDISRDQAKRPAQMLGYMAGMASILTNNDKGPSIWEELGTKDMDFGEYCNLLDIECRNEPVLAPIMELRDMVRGGQTSNQVSPSWKLPGTSRYFYTRSDTSFFEWKNGSLTKQTPIFAVTGDDGKRHQFTIHIRIIRELAKGSAILAAIIHSIDAWLKKKVSLDVWAAGGKILVKHDEFICTKGYEDIMIASYHKWMRYIADHRVEFLQDPLESCGYDVALEKFVERNEEHHAKHFNQSGKFENWRLEKATDGLGYEWTISL